MRITIEDGFLSESVCAALIALTGKAVSCASTPGYGARFNLQESQAIGDVRRAIDERTKVERRAMRPMIVHRYASGDACASHCDHGSVDGFPLAASAIVYLQAPESGGHTLFSEADVSIEPVAGRLAFWRSRFADGTTDPASRHESLQVTAGVKIALLDFIYGYR